MKLRYEQMLKLAVGCLLAMLALPVAAQSQDDLDVTMRMVTDDDELTESVIREIELSEPVIVERFERPDIDAAREAAESSRELGDSISETIDDTQDLISDDVLPTDTDDLLDLPDVGDELPDSDDLLGGDDLLDEPDSGDLL